MAALLVGFSCFLAGAFLTWFVQAVDPFLSLFEIIIFGFLFVCGFVFRYLLKG